MGGRRSGSGLEETGAGEERVGTNLAHRVVVRLVLVELLLHQMRELAVPFERTARKAVKVDAQVKSNTYCEMMFNKH